LTDFGLRPDGTRKRGRGPAGDGPQTKRERRRRPDPARRVLRPRGKVRPSRTGCPFGPALPARRRGGALRSLACLPPQEKRTGPASGIGGGAENQPLIFRRSQGSLAAVAPRERTGFRQRPARPDAGTAEKDGGIPDRAELGL